MAIAEALPAHGHGPIRTLWIAARPAVLPVGLLVLGHAPLLAMRARALWARPQLADFHLAVIAGLVLAWRGARGLGPLEPGSRSWSIAAVGLGMAVLVVAGFSAWPWLGAAAAMTMLLAGAYGLGGTRLLRAVLPAWVFVALVVLAPVGEVLWLIGALQTLVTACADAVLDALGLIHLTEGNVIKITSRPLMVEEACSGVSSLFAVVGVTLFYVLWTGRKPVAAALLVLAASFWVVLGNIARVVAVVFAEATWGIDLASDWRHEVGGFVIFAAVLGLTLSTDRLLRFLAALTTIRFSRPSVRESKRARSGSDSRSSANRLPPTEHTVIKLLSPTEFPDIGRTWLASRRIGSIFAVLGLLQVVWLWPLLAEAVSGYSLALPLESLVVRLQSLKESDMPDRVGRYVRQRFETKTRGRESSFGEFSRMWHYRSDRVPAAAAVDFPFRGWHELTECYKSVGWTLKERTVRTADGPKGGSGGAGARVEAVFERPPGVHAALIYAIDDMRGNDLQPPPTRDPRPLGGRLDILRFARRRLGALVDLEDQTMTDDYQVQLLIQTAAPPSPDQWTQARAFFEQIRQDVRRRVSLETGQHADKGK